MRDMVRLRLPEILKERKMSVYALVRASEGRIAERTVWRLLKKGGAVRLIDAELLDALAETLNCELSELLVRIPDKPKRRKRKLATAAQ